VGYDLYIKRAAGPAAGHRKPINRHTWIRVALGVPALQTTVRFPDLADDEGVEYPAFSLLGQFGRPILFWRDGEVIVKGAEDEYVPDLWAIARSLDAQLLFGDGTEPTQPE
jgi:hypothetical protein